MERFPTLCTRLSAIAALCAASLAAAPIEANQRPADISSNATALQQGNSGGDASAGDFAPQILLETDSSDTDVSVSMRFGISQSGPRDNDGDAIFGTTNATLSISVPVSNGATASLFDFNQLTNGSSLMFGLSHYWGRQRATNSESAGSAGNIINEAVRFCVAAQVERWKIDHAGDRIAMATWFAVYERRLNNRAEGMAQAALNGMQLYFIDEANAGRLSHETAQEAARVHTVVSGACNTYDASRDAAEGTEAAEAFVQRYSGPNAAAQYHLINARTVPGLAFVGLKGSVARNGYDYLDVAGFSQESTSRTPYGATAYAGYLAGNGSWSGQLSIAYQRRYEAAAERTICRPIAGGASECLSGADGLPIRNTRLLASAELRKKIRIGSMEFGIAPRIDYDIDDNQALISMPIYALRSKDTGRLNGGIRFGYGTRQDAVEARVFIGVPFSTIF